MKCNKYRFKVLIMDYLDEELNKYKDGYPNERTKEYYEALLNIRTRQCNFTITDDDYLRVGKYKDYNSVEYGFYTANIHYDLVNCDVSYRQLLQRILYFLDNANPKELLHQSGWFTLNFPYNLLRFMENEFELKHTNTSDEKDVFKCLKRAAIKSKQTLAIAVVNKLNTIIQGIKTETD